MNSSCTRRLSLSVAIPPLLFLVQSFIFPAFLVEKKAKALHSKGKRARAKRAPARYNSCGSASELINFAAEAGLVQGAEHIGGIQVLAGDLDCVLAREIDRGFLEEPFRGILASVAADVGARDSHFGNFLAFLWRRISGQLFAIDLESAKETGFSQGCLRSLDAFSSLAVKWFGARLGLTDAVDLADAGKRPERRAAEVHAETSTPSAP